MKPLPTDPTGQHARFMAAFCDDLLSRKTPAVEWLEQAGPIAAKLNEESEHDER